MLPRFAFLVALAATPALSDCPTAADLAGPGVEVRFADDYLATYRKTKPNTVTEVHGMEGMVDFQVDSYRGLLVIKEVLPDGTNGGDSYFTYDPPLHRLPEIAPGVTFETLNIVTDSYGSETDRSTVRIEAGEAGTLTLGSCTYESIDVDIAFIRPGDVYTARMAYLTELGIVVQLGGGPQGGLMDVFTPAAIGVAGK